jgi:hypothetical protein
VTPDGYEPRDDLGEQAVNDLVMRGAKEGYGPALVEMLAEAFDRGVEASARLFDHASDGTCAGPKRECWCVHAAEIRALKGGGR